MNETVIWKIFFFLKEILKTTGAGGETGRVEGENPLPKIVADCAPAGRRRGWTTPLGALGSDGTGKTSRVLPVGNQVFSLLPTLAPFRGLSVIGDGLTFWIISMVTHFHQKRDTYKLAENPRPSLPPPLPRFLFYFKLLTYFLKDILET